MKVKDYLLQIKELKRQIRLETEYIAEIKETAESASSADTSLYGTKIHKPISDKTTQLVTLAITYCDKADQHRIELMHIRDKIVEQIKSLSGMSQTVLFDIYVLDKKLPQIAMEQQYSYQRIKELHAIALYEFALKYPECVEAENEEMSCVVKRSRLSTKKGEITQ